MTLMSKEAGRLSKPYLSKEVVLQEKGGKHPIRRSSVLAPAPFTKYFITAKKKVGCPEVAPSDIQALL